MNEYEMKQEARRQRFIDLADKADQEADAQSRRSKQLIEHIPFGQPILVGHHSERAHRNALDKSWNALGKSVAASKQADYYRQRAEGVGQGGISREDPEAIQKLKTKLANMQEQRELMKKANKAYKLAVKLGVNGLPIDELPMETVNQISEKVDLVVGDLLITAIQWKPDYAYETGPYVGWPLQNLGANIRRVEQRIKVLEAEAEQEPAAPEIYDGFEVREADKRVQFIFPGKPPVKVRDILKRYAFKWSPSRGAWVRQSTSNGRSAARYVIKALKELDA